MGGTIVSAVREAGIRCRTANQMRRASKFIVQAFATAAHVHCERSVSAQTLSAGRFFFIMIIPRYCGLGVGISLGLSVNESSMPPIAHVSRAFTEKRKLGMDWLGRRQHENPSLPNRRNRKPEEIDGRNRALTHAVAQSKVSIVHRDLIGRLLQRPQPCL